MNLYSYISYCPRENERGIKQHMMANMIFSGEYKEYKKENK